MYMYICLPIKRSALPYCFDNDFLVTVKLHSSFNFYLFTSVALSALILHGNSYALLQNNSEISFTIEVLNTCIEQCFE